MAKLKEWLDGIVKIDDNGFPVFIRIPTVDEIKLIKPTDTEGMETLFKMQSYLGLKSPDAMRQANVKYLERFSYTPKHPLYQQKLDELNGQVNSNKVLTATSRRITEQAQTLTMLDGKDKHCIYVNEGDDPCDYCLFENGTEGLYSYFVSNDLLPGSVCAGGDNCLCILIPDSTVAIKSRSEKSSVASSAVASEIYPDTELGKAMRKTELSIVKNDFETGVAWDDNGKEVFRRKGTSGNVPITPEEKKRLRGQNFTHNHPGEDGHQGGTFSGGDVAMHADMGTKQYRAIDDKYVYTMTGQVDSADVDYIRRRGRDAQEKAIREVGYWKTSLSYKGVIPTEAEQYDKLFEHMHKELKKIDKDVPSFNYKRTKR